MDAVTAAVTADDPVALGVALGALPDGFKKKSDELRELLVVTLKNHQVDCFEILLQSGAPQRAPQTIFISDQVPTLLHLASRKNKFLPFVKLLTSHGALLEERNGRFETPLHVSAFHGKFLTAKHLVESGSNVHSRNFEQETPLHLACFEGSVDTVGLLINSGSDLEARNDYGDRPLHVACKQTHYECANLLLLSGAQIDSLDGNGDSPLWIALEEESLQCLNLLLERGANPNEGNDVSGFTRFHLACKNKELPFVQSLAKFGAEIDAEDNEGVTPLFVACGFGLLDIIKFLLKEGANPNSSKFNGDTPLHRVVTSEDVDLYVQLDIVEELIGAGANPLIGNAAGQRPHSVAIHPQVKARLIEAMHNM